MSGSTFSWLNLTPMGYELRLLFSLNRLRKKRGFDELTLDDIAWPEKGTKA